MGSITEVKVSRNPPTNARGETVIGARIERSNGCQAAVQRAFQGGLLPTLGT